MVMVAVAVHGGHQDQVVVPGLYHRVEILFMDVAPYQEAVAVAEVRLLVALEHISPGQPLEHVTEA